MQKISNPDLLKKQVDILADVMNYCRANSVTCFLTYGTLIGAVRHKGYIPWDDDIDIMMPRPDYMRFIAHYNAAGRVYKVRSYYDDATFPRMFARIEDPATCQEELDVTYRNGIGVSIDLYPIDGVPQRATGLFFRTQYAMRKLLYYKFYRVPVDTNPLRKGVFYLFRHAPLFLYRGVLFLFDRLVRSCPYEQSDSVALVVSAVKGKWAVFDKTCVASAAAAEFENHTFPIPAGYDTILRTIYGDYMQLPPEEQRVTRHTFSAFYK